MKRVHLFIYGDVTGVGFRAWTQREAKKLGLTGWVRNADRKTVETVMAGKKDQLEIMIEKCRQGPEVSWVENVEVKWEETEEKFAAFEIR